MEHRQVLLIGFGEKEGGLREKLTELDLEVRCLSAALLSKTVGELCMGDMDTPGEKAMDRPLVLFHNFTREGLDPVLKILRAAELPRQPLKAMVTPTNWHWKVEALLRELQQEQEIMCWIIKLKQLRDSMPMPAFTDLPAMKARMAAEVQLTGGEDVTLDTVRAAYEELLKFQK